MEVMIPEYSLFFGIAFPGMAVLILKLNHAKGNPHTTLQYCYPES